MLTKEDTVLLKQTFPTKEYLNIAINSAVESLRKRLEGDLLMSSMRIGHEVKNLSDTLANAKVDILSEIKGSNNEIADVNKLRNIWHSREIS